METSEIMISSLTFNICVVFVLIVSWILRHWRQKVEQKQESGCEEMEKTPAEYDDVIQLSYSTEVKVKSMDVFLLTDVVTSSFSFGAGLYMMTSSYVWVYPFVCTRPSPSTPYDARSGQLHSDHDDIGFAAVLSATFGTFVFTFCHLLYVRCLHGTWSIWSVLRGGYLLISIATLGVILVTRENFLGAVLLLLMELDVAIDGTCQLVDRCMTWKPARPVRILLSVVGCVVSLGTRIVMTWVTFLFLRHIYNPITMSVLSLSIASFGFIFYQAYALLVIKQHLERIRGTEENDSVTSKGYTVEPFHGKFRCLGSKGLGTKDVALYLMSEGLTEISSYAKTVAGAITGKKLLPIASICDTDTPHTPECRSVTSKIAVK